MKQNAGISDKLGIYQLLLELLNDLRLRKLENEEILEKSQKLMGI